MDLKQMTDRSKRSLIERIIGHKKRMGFKTWAKEVRKLIPVSEMNSEQLWRRYATETKEVWDTLRSIYAACSVEALAVEAAKCKPVARECQVIDMKSRKEIELER